MITNTSLVELLSLRSWVFHGRGHHKEADSLFEEALPIQENFAQLDPDSFEMRETLLGLLGRQIDSLIARRMFAEASQLQSKFLHYRRLELARDSGRPPESTSCCD